MRAYFCPKCQKIIKSVNENKECLECGTSSIYFNTLNHRNNELELDRKKMILSDKITNFSNIYIKTAETRFILMFKNIDKSIDIGSLKLSDDNIKLLNEHLVVDGLDNKTYEFFYDAKTKVQKLLINGIETNSSHRFKQFKEFLSNFYLSKLITDEYEYSTDCLEYEDYDNKEFEQIMDMANNPYKEKLFKVNLLKDNILSYVKNEKGKSPQEILGLTKSKTMFLMEISKTIEKYYNRFTFNNYLKLIFTYELDIQVLKKALNTISKCYSENSALLRIADKEYSADLELGIQQFYDIIKISQEENIELDKILKYLISDIIYSEGIFSCTTAICLYKEMIKLSKKIGIEYDKYPKNLYSLVNKLKYKCIINKNNEYDKKFAERYEQYKDLFMTNDKYLITCPKTANELCREGEKLRDCLGTYVNKYSTGESRIFFMRKIEKPDEAYVAIELDSKYRLYQSLGFANRSTTGEEDEFIAEWLRHVKATIELRKNEDLEKEAI